MTFQVLVATMYQTDYSLLEKMNIQSDAVVVNQCDRNSVEVFEFNEHTVCWICTTERGIGRSRNRALIAASADIILFADDDVVYENGYKDAVVSFFESKQDCSLAVFNVISSNPERPAYIIPADKRLHKFNCLRYGGYRIAAKREKIQEKNIWFTLNFGGGAKHQAGEDILFITNCIQKRLKCFACSKKIGTVAQQNSTWFKGYDEKYYLDRGALFSTMYGKSAWLYLFFMAFKENFSKKKPEMPFLKRYKLSICGSKKL